MASKHSSIVEAVAARRSHPSVTEDAPTHEQLLPLVAAAGRVADHSSLRPWRLIELRGDARVRLGEAIAVVQGDDTPSTKPLRASLLIAVVGVREYDHHKVPVWEQDATTAGVAHMLSLLLESEGWGTMWRTGHYTRSAPVRTLHRLNDNEELFGWLYVGGIADKHADKPSHKSAVNPAEFLSVL